MPKPLESLGALVRSKRGDNKLRETAKEIGISAATLLRIESGHIPDIKTFGNVCKWLGMDPGEFLGFNSTASTPPNLVTVQAHFRAKQNLQPDTVNALARMILLASQMKPA